MEGGPVGPPPLQFFPDSVTIPLRLEAPRERAGTRDHMRYRIFPLLLVLAAAAGTARPHGMERPALQAPSGEFYYETGERLLRSGRFEQALEPFTKLLEYARKRGEPEVEGSALVHLGRLHWNLGREAECSRCFVEALDLAKRHDLDDLLIDCRFALGIFSWHREGIKNYRSGRPDTARENLTRALALAEERGLPEQKLFCLRRLARIHLDGNDHEGAEQYYQEALDLAVELNHLQEEARCAFGLGDCSTRLGEFSRALRLLERARDIAANSHDAALEARCWNALGDVERGLGRYSNALSRYDRALKIQQREYPTGDTAVTLNRVGDTWRLMAGDSKNREDLQKALGYFTAALRIADQRGEEADRIRILRNIGNLYVALGEADLALSHFRDALRRAEAEDDREAMGRLLTDIGARLSARGRHEEGLEILNRAIDLARADRNVRYLWEAYLESGGALERSGRPDAALERYRRAVSIIEGIRSHIDLEELRADYMGVERRIEPYHRIIDIEARLHVRWPGEGHAASAFHFMERARARSFIDLLGGPPRLEFDPRLRDRERMLLKDISEITSMLYSRRLSPQQRNEDEVLLKEKETELETLMRQMRKGGGERERAPAPRIDDLESFQAAMTGGETGFLMFSLGKTTGWACFVTREDCRLYPIPSVSALGREVPAFLSRIVDRDAGDFQSGAFLYRKLLGPALADSESGVSRLVIVPDGILMYLPFEALPAPGEPFRWLLQDFEIAYAPSLTAYRGIERRDRARKQAVPMDLFAVGDPDFNGPEAGIGEIGPPVPRLGPEGGFTRLKYSDREVLRISALFSDNRMTLIRRGLATEERIKAQRLSDYRILHFATHSLINERIPQRSSLILSPGDDPHEDGLLQMREISGLRLNADLTVISSCRSGLGRYIHGEGISSLTRTFLSAGSSAVLMSLWDINDQATSQLMERFYRHLRDSMSVSGALRRVKLEMIESKNLSHPFYWAGFIASGKTDRVIFPSRGPAHPALWLLGFLLLLPALLPGVRRRGRRLLCRLPPRSNAE